MFGKKPKIIDLNVIDRIIKKQDISKIDNESIKSQDPKDKIDDKNDKEDILWL